MAELAEFPGTDVEEDSGETSLEADAPAAGDDLARALWIARPGDALSAQAAGEEADEIEAVAGELAEKEHPVSE